MKTIEQLKAEQAAAMAKLEREHATAQALPVVPDSVMDCGKRAPWASYKRGTLREALAVFDAYATGSRIVNMEHAKGTFTHICPPSDRSSERNPVEHRGDYCALISVCQGDKFGPSVEVIFYAENAESNLVRVCVRLEPQGWPNGMHQWRAVAREERNARTGRVEKRHFEPNNVLHAHSDKFLAYSSGDVGPVKTSCEHRFMFVADDGADCADFGNMRAAFETIGRAMGEEWANAE